MASVPKRPDLGRKLDDFERRLRQLERQTRLRSASIGEGGLSIYDGGGITIAPPGSVHSSDYQAGQSGWSINGDGTAEFSDITLRDGAIGFEPQTFGTAQFFATPANSRSIELSIAVPSWATAASAIAIGSVKAQTPDVPDTRYTASILIDGDSSELSTPIEGSVTTTGLAYDSITCTHHRDWSPAGTFDVELVAGAAPLSSDLLYGLQLTVLMLWRR